MMCNMTPMGSPVLPHKPPNLRGVKAYAQVHYSCTGVSVFLAPIISGSFFFWLLLFWLLYGSGSYYSGSYGVLRSKGYGKTVIFYYVDSNNIFPLMFSEIANSEMDNNIILNLLRKPLGVL